MEYLKDIKKISNLKDKKSGKWDVINPEHAARMRAQNRFKTGIDIAKYTSSIMRADMEAYDRDPSEYTQSLGCWHGFIGQQKLISIKMHFGTNKKNYLYLSGWMIAALRSEFGPLPDQSMHEKTSVASLINELYTFLINNNKSLIRTKSKLNLYVLLVNPGIKCLSKDIYLMNKDLKFEKTSFF